MSGIIRNPNGCHTLRFLNILAIAHITQTNLIAGILVLVRSRQLVAGAPIPLIHTAAQHKVRHIVYAFVTSRTIQLNFVLFSAGAGIVVEYCAGRHINFNLRGGASRQTAAARRMVAGNLYIFQLQQTGLEIQGLLMAQTRIRPGSAVDINAAAPMADSTVAICLVADDIAGGNGRHGVHLHINAAAGFLSGIARNASAFHGQLRVVCRFQIRVSANADAAAPHRGVAGNFTAGKQDLTAPHSADAAAAVRIVSRDHAAGHSKGSAVGDRYAAAQIVRSVAADHAAGHGHLAAVGIYRTAVVAAAFPGRIVLQNRSVPNGQAAVALNFYQGFFVQTLPLALNGDILKLQGALYVGQISVKGIGPL